MNSRNLNGDLDAKLASCIPGLSLDFSWARGIVVYNVEKSNVLMLLQTYWDVELKVTNTYFEFLKKRFSTNNSFVYFILAIVFSILLRYTDSDYHFGIFKIFLSWIRVITEITELRTNLQRESQNRQNQSTTGKLWKP